MKKLLINAALGVTLVALNVACEDFLNVQPKGETIPQTVDDYAYIMNFPDLMKGGENFPLYLTDDVYLPDTAENELIYKISTPLIRMCSAKALPTCFGHRLISAYSTRMWL